MKDRELLEMALEALEEVCNANILGLEFKPQYHQLITALRTALSRKALDELAEIDRELGLDYTKTEKQAPYMAVYRDGIKIIDPVTGDVSIGTPAAQPDLARVGEVGVWGEPVAIYRAGQAEGEVYHVEFFKEMNADEVLLYTHPPKQEPVIDKSAAKRICTQLGWEPKREWVELTDEDINEIHSEIKAKGMGSYKTEDIYRAIEAKLKEKNHG